MNEVAPKQEDAGLQRAESPKEAEEDDVGQDEDELDRLLAEKLARKEQRSIDRAGRMVERRKVHLPSQLAAAP